MSRPKLVLWQSETDELHRDGDIAGIRPIGDSWLVVLRASRTTEVLFVGPSAEAIAARWAAFLGEVCEDDSGEEYREGLCPSTDGVKLVKLFLKRERGPKV